MQMPLPPVAALGDMTPKEPNEPNQEVQSQDMSMSAFVELIVAG